MRILIAPDKFKGCLSATEVAASIRQGIKFFEEKNPSVQVITRSQPIGDGGEGTVSLICQDRSDCRIQSVPALNAPGEDILAEYYFCEADRAAPRAFLEMASANGLASIPVERRDPERSTSLGTGQLIRDAIQRGATEICVALGGSATVDCGAGLLQALGFEFRARDQVIDLQLSIQAGRSLADVLLDIEQIKPTSSHALLNKSKLHIIADVESPLNGDYGAIQNFAGQKGLATNRFALYRKAVEKFSAICENSLRSGPVYINQKTAAENAKQKGAPVRRDQLSLSDYPGAGAAGGLGFALLLLGAKMHPGFEFFCETVGMKALLERTDLVITGEGKLDATSLSGKGPGGMARLCKERGISCIAIAGKVENRSGLEQSGLFADIREIGTGISLEESVKRAPELISVQVVEALKSFLHVT